VTVTAGFRFVYVFVVLDISTRPARALECDGASDRRVDRAAVDARAEPDAVAATPIVGGLHHEYRLEPDAA
jgi:hypothetical protein